MSHYDGDDGDEADAEVEEEEEESFLHRIVVIIIEWNTYSMCLKPLTILNSLDSIETFHFMISSYIANKTTCQTKKSFSARTVGKQNIKIESNGMERK